MIIAATGHRPDKLGGYGVEAFNRLTMIASYYLQTHTVDAVISGLALGWDMAFAEAAIGLGIPVHGAVPFAGQESRWPPVSQQQWQRIIDRCTTVTIVSEGQYSPQAMQVRNMWMVDRAHRMCAMYDGTGGGTANCLRYAQKVGREVDNLWYML